MNVVVSEGDTLRFIAKRGGIISTREILKKYHLVGGTPGQRSRVYKITRSLIDKGLLECSGRDGTTRTMFFELTSEGRKLARDMFELEINSEIMEAKRKLVLDAIRSRLIVAKEAEAAKVEAKREATHWKKAAAAEAKAAAKTTDAVAKIKKAVKDTGTTENTEPVENQDA